VTVTDRDEIVVVGSAARGPDAQRPEGGVDAFALRLDPDGAVDTGFAGGVVTVDLGEDGSAHAVLVQTDGRAVVLADVNRTGNASPDGAAVLLGLRRDGTLDPAFGSDGVARIDGDTAEGFEAPAMTSDRDGSLLVAATSFTVEPTTQRGHVVRFDRNGHARRSFDVFAGFASGIAVLPDGKVVVDGAYADDTRVALPALLRFDPDGALDAGFGDRGVLGMPESLPGGIALDGRGRIVVTAEVLGRHFDDGVLDESFGDNGFASGSRSAAFRVTVFQSDGKIVAAGGACFSDPKGGSGCFATLARYESDRTQLCGDTDASGEITVTDGVATLRAAAGLDGPCSPAICDVDGSGAIGVTDGVNVLRAAAELPATLSCGIPQA
jgi:uncharacterized delta-60 repeat protein